MSDSPAVLEKTSAADKPLWFVGNAVIFNLVLIIIFILGLVGLDSLANVGEVSRNWAKYRCDPSVMPFASLYGYDTASNFNYCMGNVFSTFSADTTGAFSNVLGDFTTVLGTLGAAMNSIRTSVATMGGGINVLFQDFTDRISTFFFRLRLSAIQMKSLMGRMYAILFSVMYLGMSGLTGMSTFTNTSLFTFVDGMACFSPWQRVGVRGRGNIYMADVKIGDILENGEKVNGVFSFYALNHPMVKLGDKILVSDNHYVMGPDGWVMAANHPDAIRAEPWRGGQLLCLNTDTHTMTINGYTFRDFDETDEAHYDTMKLVETRLNGVEGVEQSRPYREYTPSVPPTILIKLANGTNCQAGKIKLGDRLASGGYVIGIANRQVSEISWLPTGEPLAASTLVWHDNHWQRAANIWGCHMLEEATTYRAFLVTPNSQIELANSGYYIRDYIEICSCDIEQHYSASIEKENVAALRQ
jgi:hypothetical protein